MKRGTSNLLSARFLLLYAAALGAVALWFAKDRWGSQGWFPFAVGVVAATVIFVLRRMFLRFILNRSTGDWVRVIFFLFFVALCGIAFVYFFAEEKGLALGMFAFSALFLWAALGTLFEWPGFRPPLTPDQCAHCRYDLTGNVSGVCPECGKPVPTAALPR